MGRGQAKVELGELMQRLRAMESEMPDKKNKGSHSLGDLAAKMDRFMELKSSITDRLLSVKGLIGDIREAGNTNARERIAKQQQVRQQIKEITEEYKELRHLYDKETKKRKSKYTPDELTKRGNYVQQFSREIEKIKELASRGYLGEKYRKADPGLNYTAKAADLFGSNANAGKGGAGGAKTVPVGGGGGPLSDSQQQGLAQIEQNDEAIDSMLDQMQEGVMEIGQMATAIDQEVQMQNVMLDNLEVKVDKVHASVTSINVKMKKTLEDKGLGVERFCINFICCVVLLGVIGLIVKSVAG